MKNYRYECACVGWEARGGRKPCRRPDRAEAGADGPVARHWRPRRWPYSTPPTPTRFQWRHRLTTPLTRTTPIGARLIPTSRPVAVPTPATAATATGPTDYLHSFTNSLLFTRSKWPISRVTSSFLIVLDKNKPFRVINSRHGIFKWQYRTAAFKRRTAAQQQFGNLTPPSRFVAVAFSRHQKRGKETHSARRATKKKWYQNRVNIINEWQHVTMNHNERVKARMNHMNERDASSSAVSSPTSCFYFFLYCCYCCPFFCVVVVVGYCLDEALTGSL